MGYTTPYISLPPSWENRVIYYQSFEQENNKAEINNSKLELSEMMDIKSGGIRGRCAIPSGVKSIQLKGKALSPDKPLAVSFWWSIQKEADKDSGFRLFHLTNGKGFVSNFIRSGHWCALEKPAGVLQVYYLQDIQNVGDESITTNDEIREFINLDTFSSEKQFILLVNKGREGWNCRSLFGVGMYRRPNSKIFVLQASMRCLRSIGEGQQTGHIYLSEENAQILDDELKQNFRVSISEIQSGGADSNNYEVRVNHPPVKITLKRIRRLYQASNKEPEKDFSFEFDKVDKDKYRLIYAEQEGLSVSDALKNIKRHEEDITELRKKRSFSSLTLTAEISRYLNRPCLEIEEILEDTKKGINGILNEINEFNELLYDCVIPRLFHELYDIKAFERNDPEEIELVKTPEDGYYMVKAKPDMVVKQSDQLFSRHADKSFHLDTYCFDSDPEKSLFWHLFTNGKVNKVYFTGMLTHGQSDFYIQYIDPDSYTVKRYYPDFLMKTEGGSWVIVEVKGDNKIDDRVVQAKADFTNQMAKASDMSYKIIKSSDAIAGKYQFLLDDGQ